MAAQRRTPRGGPGGSRRPGARPRRARRVAARPDVAAGTPPRARFTGRAVILVLVVAVLTVSYASSMRAYLQQRAHIDDLLSAIAEREASINALEREKQRWQDPAFVRAQARARFGYLMPGETGFQVLDADGRPLESQTSLHDPAEVVPTVPTAWWSDAWDSMELAGHPPAPSQGPATEIDGTRQQ